MVLEYLTEAYKALAAHKEVGLYDLSSPSMNLPLQDLSCQALLDAGKLVSDNLTTYAANNSTSIAYAANETANQAGNQPGFESIFAITGLLAVAYLILGRREC